MTSRLLTLIVLLGLNACSLDPLFAPSTAPQPSGRPATPPPAQTIHPQATISHPPAPPPVDVSPKQTAPLPAPPAVVALMQQAESDRSRGDLERAASKLERALRIQPGNARLWYQLARIRLQQEQPGLAEELAKKSLSLAGGQADLIRQNWSLIARARYQRGDIGGAREAEHQASSPH